MKDVVLKPQKANNPLSDTFEKDWENAISSNEFWSGVIEHIHQLYDERDKKNGKVQ